MLIEFVFYKKRKTTLEFKIIYSSPYTSVGGDSYSNVAIHVWFGD